MVTNKKSESDTEDAKAKVKVGKLEVNKETVKDLTDSEKQKVQGGLRPREPAHEVVRQPAMEVLPVLAELMTDSFNSKECTVG